MFAQTQERDRKEYNGRPAPWYLEHMLTKIGGVNLFNEPNFRLVWSAERMTPSGGTWVDWAPGLSTRDKRGDRARPLRRVAEVRMIRRYGPAEQWVLEKWCPPSLYGSPARWYSPSIIGGTMILCDGGTRRIPSQGSYPSRGEYEYAGYAFGHNEISEATVVTAMQSIIRGVEELPRSPFARIWERVAVAQQAQHAIDASFDSWALGVIEDAQPAFGGNAMVGAGTKGPSSIAAMARKMGIKEHVN